MKDKLTRDRFIFSSPNHLAAWQETNELTAHLADGEDQVAVPEQQEADEFMRAVSDRMDTDVLLYGVASALALKKTSGGIGAEALDALDL